MGITFDVFTTDDRSTFYRFPSLSTVKGWDQKTPKGFIFAAKIPQIITHEQVLVDCNEELRQVMDALEGKARASVFQFPYLNKKNFIDVNGFLARVPLPGEVAKGLRVRNRNSKKQGRVAEPPCPNVRTFVSLFNVASGCAATTAASR